SSRRRHTRSKRDWSSDVCSSDLLRAELEVGRARREAEPAVHAGVELLVLDEAHRQPARGSLFPHADRDNVVLADDQPPAATRVRLFQLPARIQRRYAMRASMSSGDWTWPWAKAGILITWRRTKMRPIGCSEMRGMPPSAIHCRSSPSSRTSSSKSPPQKPGM